MVTDTDSYRTEIEALWGNLAAAVVVVPTGAMPFALPAGGTVIVRPDRYVAAVAHDPTEFATASDALLLQLGVTRRADERTPTGPSTGIPSISSSPTHISGPCWPRDAPTGRRSSR